MHEFLKAGAYKCHLVASRLQQHVIITQSLYSYNFIIYSNINVPYSL